MKALRLTFFLLLLANLVFLVLGRGWVGAAPRGEPERLKAQIDADKLRLLPPEPDAASAKVADARPEPKPEAKPVDTKPEPAPEPKPEPKPEAKPVPEICAAVLGLTKDKAQSLRTDWRRETEVKTIDRVLDAPASWWVYIPAQADRKAAQDKADELKAMGVTDYFITNEEPNRNAISLGMFKSESGAQEHLRRLQDKGVKSARMSARESANAKHAVDVRGPAERVNALVDAALAANGGTKRAECAAH